MQKIQKLLEKSFFIFACIYGITLLVSIFFGVYFLGDTISHLQFAALGSPLTTFIQHDGLWPPFLALLFNLLLKLPVSMYLLSSIFVATILVLYLVISTLFFQLFIKSWKTSFMVATFTLSGSVGLIMQSLLSEPIFIVLWMASLFCVAQFWFTSKEKWLVGWLVTAALLPLTRYLGVVSVGWMSLVLFFKVLLDFRSKKNKAYSVWLVVLGMGMVLIPLAFYLLRTKIMIGTFLPVRDAQTIESVTTVIQRFFTTIGKDVMVLAPVAFLLGLSIDFKKKQNHLPFLMVLLLGAAVSYLLFLLVSEVRYFVLPYLPSRYVGVSYPFIISGLVVLGLWIRQKYSFKQNAVFSLGTLLLLGIIFISSSVASIKRLGAEMQTKDSTVAQVAWTGDLQKLCNPKKQKYLVAHIHSRNWLAWSYAYFCNETVVLQESGTVEKDAFIISGYALDNPVLIEQSTLIINNYTTYFYTSTDSAELDINQVFSSREKFE